jgi:predicted dehydrogenase
MICALVNPPNLAEEQHIKSNRVKFFMRYAIIGSGMMGQEHMRNLALLPDAELVAIADSDQGMRARSAALANDLGQDITAFDNMQAMMQAAAPDAVIIATPNYTHYNVVTKVMDYGPAILLEKPMCTLADDAVALERAVQDYAPLFWVGMEYRYMPPVAHFIERAHKGDAGAHKMLMIREHRFPFLEKVDDWNRFNRNSGGTFVEKCCHFFDLMRCILRDEPVRIFASGGQDVNHLDELYNGETPDIIDNGFVLIDFASGARAVLDLCMFAEGAEQQEDISLIGDAAKLEVKIPAATVTFSPRNPKGAIVEKIETPADALAAGDHHGATYFQLRDFHAALTNGGAAKVGAMDGLRAVQMGLAAQESIVTGLPVTLNFATL